MASLKELTELTFRFKEEYGSGSLILIAGMLAIMELEEDERGRGLAAYRKFIDIFSKELKISQIKQKTDVCPDCGAPCIIYLEKDIVIEHSGRRCKPFENKKGGTKRKDEEGWASDFLKPTPNSTPERYELLELK